MDIITYSNLRKNLAKTLENVNKNHIQIIITRQDAEPSVIMSLEDFNAYEETFHLMSSPKNAKRLNAAIAEVERGKKKRHKLIEE